jgi:glutamate-ammonia-ligase adenylyltransferase
VNREFEQVRSDILRRRVDKEKLGDDVRQMRARMRKQLDKSSGDQFDLKQGRGGITDLEFLVQYLALKNASDSGAVIHYRDNIRQLGTLIAAGCLPETTGRILQEAYRSYRGLLHRLALGGQALVAEQQEFLESRNFVEQLWASTFHEEA